MPRFRKKPVEIEAYQFVPTGDQLIKLVNSPTGIAEFPGVVPQTVGTITPIVKTLEGDMQVKIKDWIITGIRGEQYPCKPDIFEATYERCE